MAELLRYAGFVGNSFCSTRVILALLILGSAASGAQITLPDSIGGSVAGVPAYLWYYGCTPTAVGQIFGYWDMHGYPNLFTASGADLFQTSSVKEQISSTAHNNFYIGYPDSTGTPPPDTSIADFLHTSEGELPDGSTWSTNVGAGITGYATYRGYHFGAYEMGSDDYGMSVLWNALTSEINVGRPVLVNVDSSGDITPDHSVTAVAYGLFNGLPVYGTYNTWSENETIAWYEFKGYKAATTYGVYDLYAVVPLSSPSVPEPAAAPLVAGALGAFCLIRRRRRAGRAKGC